MALLQCTLKRGLAFINACCQQSVAACLNPTVIHLQSVQKVLLHTMATGTTTNIIYCYSYSFLMNSTRL